MKNTNYEMIVCGDIQVPQSSLLAGDGQKVPCGGGWWWVVCRPILVLSLGFDQAEQQQYANKSF